MLYRLDFHIPRAVCNTGNIIAIENITYNNFIAGHFTTGPRIFTQYNIFKHAYFTRA